MSLIPTREAARRVRSDVGTSYLHRLRAATCCLFCIENEPGGILLRVIDVIMSCGKLRSESVFDTSAACLWFHDDFKTPCFIKCAGQSLLSYSVHALTEEQTCCQSIVILFNSECLTQGTHFSNPDMKKRSFEDYI